MLLSANGCEQDSVADAVEMRSVDTSEKPVARITRSPLPNGNAVIIAWTHARFAVEILRREIAWLGALLRFTENG